MSSDRPTLELYDSPRRATCPRQHRPDRDRHTITVPIGGSAGDQAISVRAVPVHQPYHRVHSAKSFVSRSAQPPVDPAAPDPCPETALSRRSRPTDRRAHSTPPEYHG